MFSKV